MGNVVDGPDFATQETRIGALSYNASDFGEGVRLPLVIRGNLERGDPHEVNQCTLLHLRTGLERVRQQRSKRAPSRARVEDPPKNMREKEIDESKKWPRRAKINLSMPI